MEQRPAFSDFVVKWRLGDCDRWQYQTLWQIAATDAGLMALQDALKWKALRQEGRNALTRFLSHSSLGDRLAKIGELRVKKAKRKFFADHAEAERRAEYGLS